MGDAIHVGKYIERTGKDSTAIYCIKATRHVHELKVFFSSLLSSCCYYSIFLNKQASNPFSSENPIMWHYSSCELN
jgi:hypothetical protein